MTSAIAAERFPQVAVKRLFAIVNGGTPTAEDANWGGDIVWITPADLVPRQATFARLTTSRRARSWALRFRQAM